jgi:DUF1680 family protein
MFLCISTLLLGIFGALADPANAADVLAPLDLRKVKVGGEIGRRIDVTVRNNLLVLDAEKDFLAPFRAKTSGDGAYAGLGKLIDAAVKFAAYTKDGRVIALKNRLVQETIHAQASDGYIGQIAAPYRMRSLWDIHEMDYLIFALTSDYHYFGEKPSLDAARKAADYVIANWGKLPADWDRQTHVATHVSVTGLERAMLAVYGETGDKRYLDFCVRQRALPEWNLGIVIGRRDLIEGHVYAYVSRCVAQLELYRLQPEQQLLSQSRRVIRFLTAEDGMAVTGAVGQWEIWTGDQDVRGALGETCATAYQVRLYDNLLRLQGNPVFGDLMERTIFNTLFAAQSPDGRQIRYFTPLEGNRTYHPTDSYCCPCNYRRIVAELPSMTYYRASSGLAVNLYAPSEATMDLGDGVSLKVRQETDYPNSGRVVLCLDPSKPAKFPLELRIPRWCSKAVAAVNGQPLRQAIAPGTFLVIDRLWNAGDRVTLDMPMAWRLVLGRKRQSGRAAVMRGPLVYCLDPSQNAVIKGWDAADLTSILLDPASLKESADATVRPGGTACQVRAATAGFEMGCPGNLSLKLTEFPDPQGKSVYFRLPDLSVAVSDELAGIVD